MAVNDVYSKVYNENYKRVFSFIYKMCRDYHTAEELTQETFSRLSVLSLRSKERATFLHGLPPLQSTAISSI